MLDAEAIVGDRRRREIFQLNWLSAICSASCYRHWLTPALRSLAAIAGIAIAASIARSLAESPGSAGWMPSVALIGLTIVVIATVAAARVGKCTEPWLDVLGRAFDSASSATCLATSRKRMIVVRSTPARCAASIVVNSPRNNPIQISYFCEGERNRFARRPPLLPAERPGSVIEDPFLVEPEASQMSRNQNPDLWL